MTEMIKLRALRLGSPLLLTLALGCSAEGHGEHHGPEFHFGPAVWAFVLCVAMSIIASLFFDPHSIWDESHG